MSPKPTSLTEYALLFREGMVHRLNGAARAGIVMAGAFRDGYITHCLKRKTLTRRTFFVDGVESWVLDWGVGPAECWVSSKDTRHNYRTVFRQFMRDEYGIDFDGDNAELIQPFQVDHAHCCISVDQNNDADFVLLTPLERSTNAAWGSIERALAAVGYREGPEAVCNYLTMGKLLGIRPPRYSQRVDIHQQAAQYVERLGEKKVALSLSRFAEKEGVEDLIGDARRGAKSIALWRLQKFRLLREGIQAPQDQSANSTIVTAAY